MSFHSNYAYGFYGPFGGGGFDGGGIGVPDEDRGSSIETSAEKLKKRRECTNAERMIEQ